MNTVKPLNNGQVGAGGFVRYLEVSFIGALPYKVRTLTLPQMCLEYDICDELNQYM